MSYTYTSALENAWPGKSPASPKTHVPGSRLQERGHRFYSATLARWINRDPIGEKGGFNIYLSFANNPVGFVDGIGLYECRSEGFAARDPWYGMSWAESESGNSSSCDASISHWGKAQWVGSWSPVAICNSGDPNTHLKIEARHPCCRKFRVTCLFSYTASVGNLSSGTSPNRPTGISLPVTILDESHDWQRGATKGTEGIWQAHLSKAMTRTKTITLDSNWRTLFISIPGITAGTREGSDTGAWLGARFDEVFAATCSLTEVGPCD